MYRNVSLRGWSQRLSAMAFTIVTVAAMPAEAGEPWKLHNGVVVVGTDRGGLLRERALFVEKLRRDRRSVEIRGTHCMSSCTMFLGVQDVCIDPRTVFGFHGPSYYGQPLPEDDFQFWSDVMSRNLPSDIRNTYMRKWRYIIDGYVSLTGRDLSRMGYRTCENQPTNRTAPPTS